MDGRKAPVTERALIQRINRRLKDDDQAVKKTRGERALFDLGYFYILNTRHNWIDAHHVDLESLGRETGSLAPWETLEEE